MIKKDLVFAWRNLRRNKLIASINVLGLTIGISACLVIFLIVNYELSFDTFHPDGDRIYRIYAHFSGSFTADNRGVPTGFATAIKEEFTGVETVCNFHTFESDVQVRDGKGGEKDFERYNKIIVTAPVYFAIFNYYQWLEGSPDKSLSAPRQVVLTAGRAKIYFGDVPFGEMIGKEIHYRDSLSVTVSGIVNDVEEKTDLDFTEFISLSTVENSWLKDNIRLEDWSNTNSSSQLFIKASAGTPASKLEQQMSLLATQYADKNKDVPWKITPGLQPLSELHFNTELGIFDNSRSVSEKSTLHVLIAVALLLLVIASINFINLETAQASRRAKEVGVRKVLGSSRKKLIAQFLVESFILTLSAVVLSLALAWGGIRYFTDFVPAGLALRLDDPTVLIFLVTCLFTVTFLAGLYPAFVLSSYQPALALKNLVSFSRSGTRSSFIRKALTVFQFSFSQILIIATLVIGLQINYMLNKDLGFSSEAIVYFDTPWWEKPDKRFLLKNELAQIPEIQTLSLHSEPPSTSSWSSQTFEYDNGKEIIKHNVFRKEGDSSYLQLYGIQLIAGRNLQPSDSAIEYLINETYMKQLGFTNPQDVLGKIVSKKPIVGVVKDFHSRSLHTAIDPIAIYDWSKEYTCFGMKLYSENNNVAELKPTIDKIESAWKKIYPDQKFEYHFMDDTIRRFYETEQRTGKLAKTATFIAVLISCLGLFGLSSFTVIQRTKEIGIRKVLGATVNNILLLLSKDFLKLVILAFILSAPVAYSVADWWLKDFAYRMEIGAWLFIMAGLASLITAFLTISVRTVGAAKADPVKSLRYE
jgi:putative ABC transport system permease protein